MRWTREKDEIFLFSGQPIINPLQSFRFLIPHSKLQIAFLVLLNASIVTVFIIYGHVANPSTSLDNFRPPFSERSARWRPLVHHFADLCGPTSAPPRRPASSALPLLFVKTHKTGGSTVANILLREALRKAWPVCLPVFDDAHMGWPRPPTRSDVALPSGRRHCHLLAHHALFRSDLRRQLFPRRPFTFALVRDPIRQLKSALFYFAEVERLHLPARRRLDVFLNDTALYDAALTFPGGGRLRLGRDLLATELGLDRRRFKDDDAFVAFVERSFDLVGVTENFTASLVLLRRLAGLDFTALTFTRLNRNIGVDVPNLEALRRQHRAVNALDYRLYDLFARRLKQRIAEQPREDFAREVECVAAMNAAVWAFCMHAVHGDVLRLPATRWSTEHDFTQEQCWDLHMLPRDMTPRLRDQQLNAVDRVRYFARRWMLRVVRWVL